MNSEPTPDITGYERPDDLPWPADTLDLIRTLHREECIRRAAARTQAEREKGRNR